jgi:signal transduction histidine kinase
MLSFLIALSAQAFAAEPRLMTPAEIHALPRKEAALSQPVKVRGVVTYANPQHGDGFVIEDSSGAVFIKNSEMNEDSKLPLVATLVEVTGVTGAGGYAPIVRALSVIPLGQAALPISRPLSVNQLLTGRFDCRRVEVRGVVRQVVHIKKDNCLVLELDGEFGRVTALALDSPNEPVSHLIDAEVTVRGVCFTIFNERSQVADIRLQMNSPRDIEINRPPNAEPFASPLIAMDRLLPYSASGANFHRQRIRGTVIFANPDKYLYLQDGNHAVRVNLAEHADVAVGDQIEAVGFPTVSSRFVEWQQSIIRKIGTAPVPAPIAITADQVLNPAVNVSARAENDLDGRLVTLTGRLEKIETMSQGTRKLSLNCDGHSITAWLELPSDVAKIDALRLASLLSTTGICVVEFAEFWPIRSNAAPSEMRLLISNPDDVTVLQAASWWTPLRLRIALGSIALATLLLVLWSTMLRRQVKQQTAMIGYHVTQAAVQEERSRLARDLHDEIGCQLARLSLLGQLLLDKAMIQPKDLPRIQQLTRGVRSAAADLEQVIWAVDPKNDSHVRLVQQLCRYAEEYFSDTPISCGFGPLPDIPGRAIAPQFRSIAISAFKEALANILKHSSASHVSITFELTDGRFACAIQDNGCGFDPAIIPADACNGLANIRQRLLRVGGEADIVSRPGAGTTVTLCWPVADTANHKNP